MQRFQLLLVFISIFFVQPAVAADAALWSSAESNYKSGNFAGAAKDWERWIAGAPQSPEAFYNLSASYCQLNEFGPGMRALLHGASLRTNPLRILSELNLARAVEKHVGVKDGISESRGFALYFLLSPRTAAYLFSAGFWLAAFSVLLLTRQKIKLGPAIGSFVVALLLVGASLAGAINRQFFWKPAVVDSRGGTVYLARSPGENPADKLIELPSGMIVNLTPGNPITVVPGAKTKSQTATQTYVEINAPLSGWIPQPNIFALD